MIGVADDIGDVGATMLAAGSHESWGVCTDGAVAIEAKGCDACTSTTTVETVGCGDASNGGAAKSWLLVNMDGVSSALEVADGDMVARGAVAVGGDVEYLPI